MGVAYLSEADVDDGLGDEGGLVVVVHAELVLGLTNLERGSPSMTSKGMLVA